MTMMVRSTRQEGRPPLCGDLSMETWKTWGSSGARSHMNVLQCHDLNGLGGSGGFQPWHPSFPMAGRMVRICRLMMEVSPNPILVLVANASTICGEEG